MSIIRKMENTFSSSCFMMLDFNIIRIYGTFLFTIASWTRLPSQCRWIVEFDLITAPSGISFSVYCTYYILYNVNLTQIRNNLYRYHSLSLKGRSIPNWQPSIRSINMIMKGFDRRISINILSLGWCKSLHLRDKSFAG